MISGRTLQCGSYAFNLHREDIDQGNFCDVHYWQNIAEIAQQKLVEEESQARLGNATTSQLLSELIVRAHVHGYANYKTTAE